MAEDDAKEPAPEEKKDEGLQTERSRLRKGRDTVEKHFLANQSIELDDPGPHEVRVRTAARNSLSATRRPTLHCSAT